MLRVLIVEDNAVVRRILSNQLSKLNCIVDEANSRQEAIKKFETNLPYNIIFLDNQMPDGSDTDKSGLLTAEFIRDKNKTIPIISISADVEELKNDYRKFGITEFIGKSINSVTFNSMLKEAKARQNVAENQESELTDSALQNQIAQFHIISSSN